MFNDCLKCSSLNILIIHSTIAQDRAHTRLLVSKGGTHSTSYLAIGCRFNTKTKECLIIVMEECNECDSKNIVH